MLKFPLRKISTKLSQYTTVQTRMESTKAKFLSRDITANFTKILPGDPDFPTALSSHVATREKLGPRLVKNSCYTFVRPREGLESKVLCVSDAALSELGFPRWEDLSVEERIEVESVVSGQRIIGWEKVPSGQGSLNNDQRKIVDELMGNNVPYPWAQCYGGYQFGQFAGQLGDGRVISLFEICNDKTGKRYELQLKGAGLTPYSRFADGKAVLRSSIREFIVSEYLHTLGIPTTRALSLTLLPSVVAFREKVESCAIVCRFAESWIRFGNFDLLKYRGEGKMIKQLANYVAEHNFGGWEQIFQLVENQDNDIKFSTITTECANSVWNNRYCQLYRLIVYKTAYTAAALHAYGFINGVVNTDNTSIIGLSMDYGPFAFLEEYDVNFTPNHDDFTLRYSYKNQPEAYLWNLQRLGEAMAELIGNGDLINPSPPPSPQQIQSITSNSINAILRSSEIYHQFFQKSFSQLILSRMGLPDVMEKFASQSPGLDDVNINEFLDHVLDCLAEYRLDFNGWFRRLSEIRVQDLEGEEGCLKEAHKFFSRYKQVQNDIRSRSKISKILLVWSRLVKFVWQCEADTQRIKYMKSINPSFVPRTWILSEIIDRIENSPSTSSRLLSDIMKLLQNPFLTTTIPSPSLLSPHDLARWCDDPRPDQLSSQLSCSS